MTEVKNYLDDLLAIGGNLFEGLKGARHEIKAQAQNGAEKLVRRLDLVSREEFEVVRDMIAKARLMQEDLHKRLGAIEAKLGLKTASTKVKKTRASLPSVKNRQRAKSKNAKK